MKFLCDNCKAKYQIPDEKVAGRTLRMQCRKCGHDILVRGGAESIAPSPASVASARPSPASIAASSPVPRTRGTGSHVGPAPARAASAVPSALSADFRNKVQNHALGAEESSNVPEELWHVAINDVPVGPIRREELARKIGVGAVTGESLVWREGFDDWKPLREVAQLASLLRHLRAPPPAPGSGGESRPAPLGGRLGGAASVEEHGFQDEATVVGESPYESELAAPPAARAPASATPARVASVAAPVAARVAPASAAAPAPQRVAPAPSAAPARVAPATAPAPVEAPAPAPERAAAASVPAVASVTPANDSLLPPAVSEPPAGFAPIAAAAVPTAAAAPIAVAPTAPISVPPPAPIAAAAEPRRERSPLPVGAMMGIAFAGMAGIGFAIVIASRMMNPAPAEPSAAGPTPAPAPVVAQAPAPDVDTDVTDDTVQAEVNPAAPTPQKLASRPATGTHPAAAAGTGSRPATANGAPLSASERAMMARFAEESGGGPSQIDVGRAGPSTNARPLDGQAISQVVTRNRLMLQRCYERASRGMAEAPTTRMDISLRVSPSGAVTNATVNGADFGGLAACIQSTVSRWRFPESSGGGETRFPMVFQGGG